MKIGFVGLGLMGGGIVRHISSKVPELSVYDITPSVRKEFKSVTTVTKSLEELLDRSQIVILSLPGSPEVEAVMDTVLANSVSGKTVIDLSTSYPKSSQRLHKKVLEAGGAFLDASLTGNPARALEGKLHAIVGGTRKDYERMKSVFSLFTERTFYAGGPGTGNLIKLGTNYLAVLYINLYAEVFALIEKNGGDLNVFYDVVSKSVAGCGMFERIAPKIMNDRYEVSFLLKHAIKDLVYMKQLGIDEKVPSTMLDAGLSQFLVAKANGLEGNDVSEVAKVLKNWILAN